MNSLLFPNVRAGDVNCRSDIGSFRNISLFLLIIEGTFIHSAIGESKVQVDLR